MNATDIIEKCVRCISPCILVTIKYNQVHTKISLCNLRFKNAEIMAKIKIIQLTRNCGNNEDAIIMCTTINMCEFVYLRTVSSYPSCFINDVKCGLEKPK